MIEITNFETIGWEAAIRGMRNPMNSWDKSDSLTFGYGINSDDYPWGKLHSSVMIGPNDLDLMKKLAHAGDTESKSHSKFRRMIVVYIDILAPLYWWKEFDTYKVGTVANSCSTMHMIHAKEFTLDDFSHEHLIGTTKAYLNDTIDILNECREQYLKYDYIIDKANFDASITCKKDICWWQMIQLLPSSYNQKRTVMLNYEVLATIYRDRRNHKLDEWRIFCEWIEKTLPYAEELICGR